MIIEIDLPDEEYLFLKNLCIYFKKDIKKIMDNYLSQTIKFLLDEIDSLL